MALSYAAQLGNDVEILKLFYHAFCKFDDARIAFEECKQYKGDAETRANAAYRELQDAAKAAEIVAERMKEETK
jgi:hypothetical protein